jgi:release factor glutamine methyltransferase
MDTQDPRRVDALLRAARSRIEAVDAGLLLAHVLGKSHGWLYAHDDAQVDAEALARFDQLVARRQHGEPVAYLIGRRGFWTLDLLVTPDTLIPRPETELLVELALQCIPEGDTMPVADLGTGSGGIALAIARERPATHVIGTDHSQAALAVAAANARANAIANVEFRHGDWLSPLAGERFGLIASNPPYIAQDDPHLAQGDLRFEPAAALASGRDGLDAIRRIVSDAPAHLVASGWLLLEHGHDQGQAVRALLTAAGLGDVRTALDLEGRDRVTLGRLQAER